MAGDQTAYQVAPVGSSAMNRNKQLGTAFETLIVDWLRKNGHPWARRNPPAGSKDVGDIGGVPLFVLECKRWAKLALAEWVDEAHREAVNAEAPFFAVIHKRKGKGRAGDQYVTMPLWVFAELIK